MRSRLRGGLRGTLTDAFGVYSDPAIAVALKVVPILEPMFLSMFCLGSFLGLVVSMIQPSEG